MLQKFLQGFFQQFIWKLLWHCYLKMVREFLWKFIKELFLGFFFFKIPPAYSLRIFSKIILTTSLEYCLAILKKNRLGSIHGNPSDNSFEEETGSFSGVPFGFSMTIPSSIDLAILFSNFFGYSFGNRISFLNSFEICFSNSS